MQKQLAALLLICATTLCLDAQIRKEVNAFLDLGMGGRGWAMSHANAATVNDATGGYYNPAGLTEIKTDFDVFTMFTPIYQGIGKYNTGAVAFKLPDGSAMGVSVIRLGIDDIANTLFLFEPDGSINYDNIESFSWSDYAGIFSYARKIPIKDRHLNVGGSVKVIYRKAGPFAQAWGFGLDAGIQYHHKNLHLGFMGRDLTSTFNAWSFDFTEAEQEVLIATGNELPVGNTIEVGVPRLIFAGAYSFWIKEKFKIQPELNAIISTDGHRNVLWSGEPFSMDLAIGLETSYKDMIFLRTGLGKFQRATENRENGKEKLVVNPTFGLGFHIANSVAIDYAFEFFSGASLGLNSHVFSLRLSLNKQGKKS